MQLARVALEVLEVPFRAPLETAAGTWRSRRLGLVRLGSITGHEGVGEVAVDRPAGIDRLDGLDEATLVRSLEGLDVTDAAALEGRLGAIDTSPRMGRPLRSAVESGVLDLLARTSGVSVAQRLGERPHDSVRVNAFIGLDDPARVAQQARQHVSNGFSCLKLKGTDEPIELMVQRLAAVRAAVGPGPRLRVDFNGSLSRATAARALVAMAPFDLEYAEQPIAAGAGVEAWSRLRRTSPVALAADESVDGVESAERLLAAGAVDVMVLKPARVGGLRTAARIARMAADAGVRTVVSTMFESGLGVAGALHLAVSLPGDQAHGLATLDLLLDDLLVEPLVVVDGRMSLPRGPGLGVELDAAALERRRLR